MKRLAAGDPNWIGGYRLLGRLGEGGMGRVYLARSSRGRTVAVKAVQDELARQPDFRRRFALEITAARKVGGDWTAPVLDADTEAATPWVATGYIAGPSLSEVVDEQYGPLPADSVQALASGLVRALHDIHGAGLVHRDLKPSNVLITIDGPRVIDFGIARALDSAVQSAGGLTRTGALVGSPGFMSPEQVRGLQTTQAGDIFCLGAVLAYAATGRMPFGTADSGVHALLFRIAEEEPELSGLDGALLDMVAACLAKKPEERPTLEMLLQRTEGGLKGTWLPGEVLAQLGRHAVQLLDSEDPESAGTPDHAAAPAQGQAAGPAQGQGQAPGQVAGLGPGPGSGAAAAATGAPAAPSTADSTPPPGPYGPPGSSTPPPGPYNPAPNSPYSTPPRQGRQWQPGFPGQGPAPGPGPVAGPAHGPAPAHRPAPAGGRPPLPARSPRKLSQSFTVLMSLHVLLGVIGVIVDLSVITALDAAVLEVTVDDVPGYGALQGASIAVEIIGSLLSITVIVLWCAWFWRVRVNAETFSPGGIRYTSALSVGVWFIPVCNLFMPKQVMNDVWGASDPAVPNWYGYGPRPPVRRGLVNTWWIFWLVYLVFLSFNWDSWYDKATVSDAELAVVSTLFMEFFGIPAAILAIVVVTRLTNMQDGRLSGRPG